MNYDTVIMDSAMEVWTAPEIICLQLPVNKWFIKWLHETKLSYPVSIHVDTTTTFTHVPMFTHIHQLPPPPFLPCPCLSTSTSYCPHNPKWPQIATTHTHHFFIYLGLITGPDNIRCHLGLRYFIWGQLMHYHVVWPPRYIYVYIFIHLV